ncbi:hypothetical protein LTR53_017352 [Teratosphaeriaceae sp. CCFEE 6253]|nr:hypothetical protein LTR53_017352 [Teratosphaeriaceae sp. CCFEE 6253]
MSSSDYEPQLGDRPTPQKRAKTQPQHRKATNNKTNPVEKISRRLAKATEKADRQLAHATTQLNTALHIRLINSDKMAELDAVPDKDDTALAILAAIRTIQVQGWPSLVFHLYLPPPELEEAHNKPEAWHTYCFTRGEVVSKLLDFVFLHIDICVALGRVEYCSLWAHTQIEETIPSRIQRFADFLIARGAQRGNSYDIVIRKWIGGENYTSWIEVFQVDAATWQEDEELLDFRIW